VYKNKKHKKTNKKQINNNNNNIYLQEWQETRKGNCPPKMALYKGNKLNTNTNNR